MADLRSKIRQKIKELTLLKFEYNALCKNIEKEFEKNERYLNDENCVHFDLEFAIKCYETVKDRRFDIPEILERLKELVKEDSYDDVDLHKRYLESYSEMLHSESGVHDEEGSDFDLSNMHIDEVRYVEQFENNIDN